MILLHRSSAESTAVFLVTLLIYLLLPTTNYYWDGLIYGDFIERSTNFGPNLFHANHLIYNHAGYLVHRAGSMFVDGYRALYALQLLTIFAAAACAAIFYSIARKLFGTGRNAILLTALLAFAAGWWRFATDADVYIISIGFLLLSFYLMLAAQTARPYLAATSFAVAVLFHQLALFFLPVLFLLLLIEDGKFHAPSLKRAITAASMSLALIAVAYVAAYWSLTGSITIPAFLDWITSRAEAANRPFTFGEGVYWLVAGTRRLFFDGSIKLLGRDPVSIAAVSTFAVLSLGLVASVIFGLTKRKDIDAHSRFPYRIPTTTLAGLCMAWIAPYVIFLMIFMPESTFYRLFYFPPLVLLIGLLLTRVRWLNARRETLPLLVAAFAVYNFTFYIYPNSYVREGSVLAAAIKGNEVWTPETRILYDPAVELDGSNRLLAYFNPKAKWINFESLTDAEKADLLSRTDDKDVWIETSLLKRYPGARLRSGDLPESEVVDIPQLRMQIVKVRAVAD